MSIYPLPTQPPKSQVATASRTLTKFVPYPAPTTAIGKPIKFAPIKPIRIKPGSLAQINPVLLDGADVEQIPTEPFGFSSSSPFVFVNSTGLVSENLEPNVVSRRGASVNCVITVSYGNPALAPITTTVSVTAQSDFNNIVSD